MRKYHRGILSSLCLTEEADRRPSRGQFMVELDGHHGWVYVEHKVTRRAIIKGGRKVEPKF